MSAVAPCGAGTEQLWELKSQLACQGRRPIRPAGRLPGFAVAVAASGTGTTRPAIVSDGIGNAAARVWIPPFSPARFARLPVAIPTTKKPLATRRGCGTAVAQALAGKVFAATRGDSSATRNTVPCHPPQLRETKP